MKIFTFCCFFFFISCSEKFTDKMIRTSDCYSEFESIKKKYNNEIVTFDVCVGSKGVVLKINLNDQLTTTQDSFLIDKAQKEVTRYFYPIPYPDEKYPNRCGKIRVKFTKK